MVGKMTYHQYDIRLLALAVLRSGKIIQGLFTIPGGGDAES